MQSRHYSAVPTKPPTKLAPHLASLPRAMGMGEKNQEKFPGFLDPRQGLRGSPKGPGPPQTHKEEGDQLEPFAPRRRHKVAAEPEHALTEA